MRRIAFTSLVLFTLSNQLLGQAQNNYDLISGNGNGVRFWNGSDSYKIHMGTGTEYTYGGVTDYSIKMNMNSTAGRGWVWGIVGQNPIASLNNQGDFHFQGELYANNGWLRVKGNKGLYFQDYGGGFFMQDDVWIRTYGNKSFYHNSGIMRTDGRFEVGSSGNRFRVLESGLVGIGTTSPSAKLEVRGSIKSSSDTSRSINIQSNGDGNAYINYLGGSSTSRIGFQVDGGSKMSIMNNGSVGIGTINTGTYKLEVEGSIRAREVKVDAAIWPDYVFKKDYDLPTLRQVEKHIKEKGHLINIPSSKEVEENGIQLGEMNKLLLEKIEELTLYTLQQQKQLTIQNEKNKSLEERLERLESIKEHNLKIKK